ncbi:MAG: SpoIIE family protein phosphatase [Rhodobacteraceae bacterium]|jgi:sigma-B regulation protein RsbU (phosphoserine phosphatase)|nr:SpoIIE family protein phosphatase [Paracoccaceae bacterium]
MVVVPGETSLLQTEVSDWRSEPPRVLVVDDSRAQRRLLAVYLRRWGYDVRESSSAEEALALCAAVPVDIILSDWMMEGMTGVEFCKRLRALPREGSCEGYCYFILLTSKSEKSEIARGLEAGADDFVTKPVSSEELNARLRAGMRILSMQAELVEKNRLVAQALGALQRVYDSIERDLVEARKLQQTLLRDRLRDYGAAKVAMMVRASGHVGGDLVGSFRIDERRIAVWSVDVSGHGVASAMMSARLAGYLSGSSPEQNLAFLPGPDGSRITRSPAQLMAAFNRLMIEDVQVEQYFTMAYAEIDLASGVARLAQAGHPHPAVLRASGVVDMVGVGGLPVGLIPGAEYEDAVVTLAPGDRLVLMSDGITECPGRQGDLGADGAAALLAGLADLPSDRMLEALIWELATFAGTDQFPDDVSVLVLDYRGPPTT